MANEFGYFIKSFTFIYFRSKNTVNILIKNWLDMCIGALVYWAVGFALTFGDSFGRILGTSYFFFYSMPGLKNFFLFLIITIIKKKFFSAYKLSKWFFQFVFAATAATLVSGSLAERCSFTAYIVYSIMITGFIYPIIAHWVWHPEGWLSIMGFHDFAGSAVVHLTGGTYIIYNPNNRGCVEKNRHLNFCHRETHSSKCASTDYIFSIYRKFRLCKKNNQTCCIFLSLSFTTCFRTKTFASNGNSSSSQIKVIGGTF